MALIRINPEAAVPDELNDRAADSWEPLLAVAVAAGEPWPTMARLAAVSLSSEEDAPVSVGMRLLADIRDAFGGGDHLHTSELLKALHDLDDAPWADWYGGPLTARALAKLLDPYRIGPAQRRVRGEKSRGYFRSDFADAWIRYSLPGTGTSGTSGTPNVSAPFPELLPVPDVPDVPVPETPTVLDFDAPLCDVCGRRKRRVPDGPFAGTYICTFPHKAVVTDPMEALPW